jgi:hypothetical protein
MSGLSAVGSYWWYREILSQATRSIVRWPATAPTHPPWILRICDDLVGRSVNWPLNKVVAPDFTAPSCDGLVEQGQLVVALLRLAEPWIPLRDKASR